MDLTILEPTANSLSENFHDTGEALHTIYGDADLLENDPVVCLVCVSYMRMGNLSATDCPETFRPSG
jgi:hypothetical protein